MLITFSERFTLPVEEVFSYFASPTDWARLYGTDYILASREALRAVRAGEVSKLSPVTRM